jgi:hypothetical protein
MAYDDDSIPLGYKVAALGVLLAFSGLYHKFATTNQEIINAKVLNKHTRTRLVRRRSGKSSYWTTETDYYIETDKGLIMDEGCLWEWDAEGDEYSFVTPGKTYNFQVNHDDLLGTNTALEVTEVAATGSAVATPTW